MVSLVDVRVVVVLEGCFSSRRIVAAAAAAYSLVEKLHVNRLRSLHGHHR